MCCTRLAENTGHKKSPSGHHRASLSRYIFATKARIDNQKKMLNSNIYPRSSQYGELRPTRGWDRLASLEHHCKFQQVSRLGSVTARQSSSGRQPTCAALNRGRHLYLAGRPSRWELHHISSFSSVLDGSRCHLAKMGPKWCYFVNFRCTGRSRPNGPYWGPGPEASASPASWMVWPEIISIS